MNLSNLVTYGKKASLHLSIDNSKKENVENTHCKPQETLEFKMDDQTELFALDEPLALREKWMMGLTSLEIYNTVYLQYIQILIYSF